MLAIGLERKFANTTKIHCRVTHYFSILSVPLMRCEMNRHNNQPHTHKLFDPMGMCSTWMRRAKSAIGNRPPKRQQKQAGDTRRAPNERKAVINKAPLSTNQSIILPNLDKCRDQDCSFTQHTPNGVQNQFIAALSVSLANGLCLCAYAR